QSGEYDLAGCIVGVVDRKKLIDGKRIKPGDIIFGLKSDGLHTNGYSLARQILFEKMRLKPSSRVPELKKSLGEELLRVHKMYQVFNMGIGMAVIVAERDGSRTKTLLKAIPIGRIERGTGKTRLVF